MTFSQLSPADAAGFSSRLVTAALRTSLLLAVLGILFVVAIISHGAGVL